MSLRAPPAWESYAVAAALMVVVVLACGDPTTSESVRDPDDDSLAEGSISFAFSGAVSGEFSASGLPAVLELGADVAFATVSRGGEMLALFVARTRGSVSDYVTLTIRDFGGVARVAEAPLSYINIGVGASAPAAGAFMPVLEGNVVVVEFTATRIRGTFAAIASALVLPNVASDTVWITDGRFDLPIVRP